MHTTIIGQTGSGKTTLACALIHKHIRAGNQVITFNPRRENLPIDDNIAHFSTIKGFYNAVNEKRENKILIYIDETPTLMHDKKSQKVFETFITTARHIGEVIMCTQRPRVVISPTILSQCEKFIIMGLNFKDDIKLVSSKLDISIDVIENIPKFGYIEKIITK